MFASRYRNKAMLLSLAQLPPAYSPLHISKKNNPPYPISQKYVLEECKQVANLEKSRLMLPLAVFVHVCFRY